MSEKAPEKKPDAAPAGDKKADAHKDGGGAAKGGGMGALLGKMPVLLGGAMIIEAVVLFAGFKFLGQKPAAANAEITAPAEGGEEGGGESKGGGESEGKAEEPSKGSGGGEHGSGGGSGGGAEAKAKPIDKKKPVEIKILEFRAPNKLSGRTFLYDVQIYAVTRGANAERVNQVIEDRKALISDRVRTIIAQTDPEKLGGGSEPGLETLRRQVKYQLDQIVGEGLIEEVLVPRCIPFRTDY